MSNTVDILPSLPTALQASTTLQNTTPSLIPSTIEGNLISAGITRPYLYEKLKEQLEAVKPNMEPDYIARDRALERCLKLLGDLRDAPVVNVDARRQSVTVTNESLVELRSILEKMSELEESWRLLTPTRKADNGDS